MEPKQKQYPVVDVTGDRSNVQCCKEQYCIGTWNVRSMNQGKLEVVKEEMARIDILGSDQISRSVVSDSLRPHESQHTRPPCPSPTPGVHSDHVHLVSDTIQPSHPLSSPSPAPNPSQHQSLFQWVNSLHEVAKVLEFQLYIIPSKEIPGLISFRMDWLYLLAVQGTLKSLLQHHSSKASILRCSAFFTVQLSHPYMTTGKTIALTRRTFVDKVMSLLLNMLSRLVIIFLPRSKRLLISWLQSPSVVILEPRKIKSDTVSLSISHEVVGPDAMIFVFWMLSFKPTFSLSTFTFIIVIYKWVHVLPTLTCSCHSVQIVDAAAFATALSSCLYPCSFLSIVYLLPLVSHSTVSKLVGAD